MFELNPTSQPASYVHQREIRYKERQKAAFIGANMVKK